MIKLVVSDMDGTLLDKSSNISKGNKEAIDKLESHHIEFAIASGRDYDGVYSIMNDYDIECEAILGNGAQYVDKNGNVIMSCYMNKDIVRDVVDIFQTRDIPYMIFTTQGFYTGQSPKYVQDNFIERARRRFGTNPIEYQEGGKNAHSPCMQLIQIDDFDEFLKKDLDIIKVEAFSLNPQEIVPIKELLKDIPTISYLSSFDDNVEVTDQQAQKGYILEKVAKLKGLTKEEVMVLGDGMNDLSLFQCFKYSFAPSNAEKGIKDLAYKIVSDCQEDGFKEAIDDMIK